LSGEDEGAARAIGEVSQSSQHGAAADAKRTYLPTAAETKALAALGFDLDRTPPREPTPSAGPPAQASKTAKPLAIRSKPRSRPKAKQETPGWVIRR